MTGKSKWTQPISSFAIGLGVGAALGVLFAPNSGEETRDFLLENVNDGIDAAVSRGQKLSRRAEKAVDNAKNIVRDATTAGGQAYDEAKRV